MRKVSNPYNNTGVGVLGLLGVLFIGLKLTGHITWSWWFVTMPFWLLPVTVVVLLGLILLICIGIATSEIYSKSDPSER